MTGEGGDGKFCGVQQDGYDTMQYATRKPLCNVGGGRSAICVLGRVLGLFLQITTAGGLARIEIRQIHPGAGQGDRKSVV